MGIDIEHLKFNNLDKSLSVMLLFYAGLNYYNINHVDDDQSKKYIYQFSKIYLLLYSLVILYITFAERTETNGKLESTIDIISLIYAVVIVVYAFLSIAHTFNLHNYLNL